LTGAIRLKPGKLGSYGVFDWRTGNDGCFSSRVSLFLFMFITLYLCLLSFGAVRIGMRGNLDGFAVGRHGLSRKYRIV